MRIAAGELDRRITICRAEMIDDGTASVEGPAAPIGKRWAKKTDIRDGEKMAAGENATDLASRFLVRSDSLTRTIGGKDVIQYKGRSFFVVGVKESGDREDGIEITTSSRSDQA
ncbi:head-tail adaptor protein [Sphingomonas melonis]|uniref:phage head completion protein n=1 Tax=Sphingomonas melonis TaxID=152682 RepID=UPI0003A303AF|nr:head-tail adaptor protein [Sphingomonas melonis]